MKKLLGIIFIFISSVSIAQAWFVTDDHINKEWQVGVGFDIVRFSSDDIKRIGDKHLIQIPRVNVTKEFTKDFALDIAFSAGTFDSALSIENAFTYFGFDASARYKYYKKWENVDPYIFAGLSYVDLKEAGGATINLGTGLTYWLNRNIGINGQILYKNALDKQKMASHAQFCGSIIFGFNSSKRINSSRCSFDR